jgi:hypothetical protein
VILLMDVEDSIHEDVLFLLIVEHLRKIDSFVLERDYFIVNFKPFFIASRINSRSFFGYLSNKRFSKTNTAAS